MRDVGIRMGEGRIRFQCKGRGGLTRLSHAVDCVNAYQVGVVGCLQWRRCGLRHLLVESCYILQEAVEPVHDTYVSNDVPPSRLQTNLWHYSVIDVLYPPRVFLIWGFGGDWV
jgi:hypothetical protein